MNEKTHSQERIFYGTAGITAIVTVFTYLASGPKGISYILVEKGTPGLGFGKKERKVKCSLQI